MGVVAAAAAGTLPGYKLLQLGGEVVKWGAPELGAGTVVTYAVTERPLAFDGARNCAKIGPVDDLLAANRMARSDFDRELEAAFRAWSQVANIAFRVADPAAADILIGAQTTPRGRAFTNVVHAPSRDSTAPSAILKSVICLNPATGWKIGFDGNLDVYDIRYTLTHEIGHAIGLDHPGTPHALMDFRYREAFAALQPGDRAGAVDLYGPNRATAGLAHEIPEPSDKTGVAERALGFDPSDGRNDAP